MGEATRYITPAQLQIGLYVHLDLGWMDHPFTFGSFKIKTDEQIATLRQLGLARIRYEPGRSSAEPLALEPVAGVAEPPATAVDPAVASAAPEPPPAAETAGMAEKRQRICELQRVRSEMEKVEQEFRLAAEQIRQIARDAGGQPERAKSAATALVGSMIASLCADQAVKLHALDEQANEDTYYHSLNVMVLALILGKAAGLAESNLQSLGLGALFHDAGLQELPPPLLAKGAALNRAEQSVYESHVEHGARLGRRLGLDEHALAVLGQHHEAVDGSGYPRGLKGDQIPTLVRIVAIADHYDELCNPSVLANASTPADALSLMYARQRARFDETLLKLFIRCLGVYPPGSIVQLSNDMTGLVLSVNPQAALRPTVLVHDPETPREEAVILDLQSEPELRVLRSLRPALVPREVLQYLRPRKHVTYFFDPQQPVGKG